MIVGRDMEHIIGDDPIVIDAEEFKRQWTYLKEIPIPSIYLQKVEQLKHTYSCFHIKQQGQLNSSSGNPNNHNNPSNYKQHRGDYRNTKKDSSTYSSIDEYPITKNMRPRIGALFTNTEGKARKNFIAFMNKLSPHNKDEILQNFIKSLTPDNIPIYMDQMIKLFQFQPTYHDLYTEVMYQIVAISPNVAIQFITDHFESFIKKEQIRIPNTILANLETADSMDETSDGLCDYVKWKRNIKSLLLFYIRMISSHIFGSLNNIELLLTTLIKICDDEWEQPKTIDIYLDIMLCSIQAIDQYIEEGLSTLPNIVDQFRIWNSIKHTLPTCSKFKIMDIMDIVDKKSMIQPLIQTTKNETKNEPRSKNEKKTKYIKRTKK